MPILDDDQDTLLEIPEIGLPRYSARAIHQTISPIDAASNLKRTVNGELDDVSYSQFHKLETIISCTDQMAPALDGVMPGMIITIKSCAELAYKVGGTPSRTPVTGSERTVGDFVYFRPLLECRITSYNQGHDEWPHDYNWEITAEEI